MTFGEDWGWGSSKDEAKKIYDAFREAGGNFIDTANIYTNGESESFLDEFLKGHRGSRRRDGSIGNVRWKSYHARLPLHD